MSSPTAALSLGVQLRREDVLHFLGYRGRGLPGPRIEQMLHPVLDAARSLIVARGLYHVASWESAPALDLKPRPGARLALGLVTIGPELEREVSRLLAEGESTRALLLDAAGSAAAEAAADQLEGQIHPGRPRRFSPGYGCWPLTAQRALFDLLPHEEIHVRLLPSCLMSPRKSVSFAVWLSPEDEADVPEECRASRCADCDLTTCPYREGPGRRAADP